MAQKVGEVCRTCGRTIETEDHWYGGCGEPPMRYEPDPDGLTPGELRELAAGEAMAAAELRAEKARYGVDDDPSTGRGLDRTAVRNTLAAYGLASLHVARAMHELARGATEPAQDAIEHALLLAPPARLDDGKPDDRLRRSLAAASAEVTELADARMRSRSGEVAAARDRISVHLGEALTLLEYHLNRRAYLALPHLYRVYRGDGCVGHVGCRVAQRAVAEAKLRAEEVQDDPPPVGCHDVGCLCGVDDLAGVREADAPTTGRYWKDRAVEADALRADQKW